MEPSSDRRQPDQKLDAPSPEGPAPAPSVREGISGSFDRCSPDFSALRDILFRSSHRLLEFLQTSPNPVYWKKGFAASLERFFATPKSRDTRMSEDFVKAGRLCIHLGTIAHRLKLIETIDPARVAAVRDKYDIPSARRLIEQALDHVKLLRSPHDGATGRYRQDRDKLDALMVGVHAYLSDVQRFLDYHSPSTIRPNFRLMLLPQREGLLKRLGKRLRLMPQNKHPEAQ